MEKEFFICNHCGNIITKLTDKKVPVFCCGEKMNQIQAGTIEASAEKHIPVCVVEDRIALINIGSIEHPMTNEHYIEWVVIHTNKGEHFAHLSPQDKPFVKFALIEDETVSNVFAYCNLHGLWKA